MRQKFIIISILIIVSLIAILLFLYNYISVPSTSISCPALFADLSYKPVSGVKYMIKLSSGIPRYEFVMSPNSTGVLAVNYYSEVNNLTDPLNYDYFLMTLYPWKVDTVNNRIDLNASSNVVVKPVKTVVTSIHNVTVYYLIDTRGVEPSTYEVCIIPFPSTCLQAVLVIGDKPYYGPFPWEGHVYA